MAVLGAVTALSVRHLPNRATQLGIAILAIVAVIVGTVMTGVIVAVAGLRDPTHANGPAVTGDGIPDEALAAYQSAAEAYQVDWAIVAAIGWEECRHGTSQLAGCMPETTNPAGARGYMQFLGSTWRVGLGRHQLEPRSSPPAAAGEGFATDGDADGDADPWSWPDAAHSAARYLTHLGIQQDPQAAIHGYNHDMAYVDRVLATADRYRNSNDQALNLTTVQGITINTQIADDVAALLDAAAAEGLHLHGSGYRDNEHQIDLRRAHCGTSRYAIYEMPSSQCSPPTARPGASMHEQGLAIDFTCDGVLITARTSPCYEWLDTNAAQYGLHELSSGAEPWHFSTNAR